MPHTFHEAVQRAIIVEEEVMGSGLSRLPRPLRSMVQRQGVQSISSSKSMTRHRDA